jgi:hypothetical protein
MTPHQAYYKCIPNKQRDKDLEQYIIKDSYYAYFYAKNVIKGRWVEAENIISTSPPHIYWYAIDVIKGKLPENMHNMMLLHADKYSKLYLNFIKNKPQP